MSNDFSINDPKFEYDDYRIGYRRFMSEPECERYSRDYPHFARAMINLGGDHYDKATSATAAHGDNNSHS